MTPPIKICPSCGCDMQLGERVKLLLQYEYDGNVITLSRILCRGCAGKLADNHGISVPDYLTTGR